MVISLNSNNQMSVVLEMHCVFSEVQTEFLNIIQMNSGFKGLNLNSVNQLIFVMAKCGVLFEVQTEFLNNI